MRTTKPYSNATFSKRVDHDAGRHRPPKTAPGLQVCPSCGAAYVNRRWVQAGQSARHASRTVVPRSVLCPGCRMAAEGTWRGEVRMSGSFLSAHRPEVERLLRNEAARAGEDNPTGRITRWMSDGPDALTVRTTSEHLAKRLGQALHKAFRGRVRYQFSHENKFAHVLWSREAPDVPARH
jgi:NMD protein affecting ribosome stability and mRNA decay